ncbi:MAG: phosphate regulon sensor histidine kinase PhoR [Gammaproteobacteria bacterium]
MGSWIGEIWRIIGIVLLSLFFGVVVNRPSFGLLLGLTGYLAWHLINLYRLEQWLEKGPKYSPPQAGGIWGDAYMRIYRLQLQNRKRKRRLKKILRAFRESTAAMPDAGLVLGPNGEIQWWNDAAQRLLDLRSPRDVGLRIDNLLRHPRFIEYLNGETGAESVEIPSPHDDSIMLNLRLVRYGRNQQLLTIRDVSQVHRLERVRRDFVANVSHELRTPLTVLRGYLETLSEGEELSAERRKALFDTMRQQTRRMEQLLDELLMLARLEGEENGPAAERVVVADLLKEIHDEARVMSGERHNIALMADSELGLLGVAGELRSAFANLVSNAIQYTPEGGEIRIRWYRDGGEACCEVRDTGEGIDPKHLPRLTERFYRVDSSRSRETGGTGLGLAIVKHVLERHQGRLEVESRPGQGSTFRCRFGSERTIRLEQAAREGGVPG